VSEAADRGQELLTTELACDAEQNRLHQVAPPERAVSSTETFTMVAKLTTLAKNISESTPS
jgi:hypothetical protein